MPKPPETRWLNDTQKTAWLGLLAVMHRTFPELERTFREHDTLAVQYHLFVQLSEAPDRTLRLSDLADRANVSQSRLTHRLRSLVERGDIAIAADSNDRRSKNATLTDAGFARLEQIAPQHAEDVQRLIFDPLTNAETEALAAALSKIASSLCEHPEYLNP